MQRHAQKHLTLLHRLAAAFLRITVDAMVLLSQHMCMTPKCLALKPKLTQLHFCLCIVRALADMEQLLLPHSSRI